MGFIGKVIGSLLGVSKQKAIVAPTPAAPAASVNPEVEEAELGADLNTTKKKKGKNALRIEPVARSNPSSNGLNI